MLTTDQKGVVAELEIARQAAELEIGVWAAHTIERYDLIFDRLGSTGRATTSSALH